MAFAVVETGGKQVLTKKGEIIEVERIEGAEKKEIKLDRVLLYANDKRIELGKPYLKGSYALCEVMSHVRGPKVIAYKYKRRKSFKFKKGHRQNLTVLRVKELHMT